MVSWRRNWFFYSVLVLACLVYVSFRLQAGLRYLHMDEQISVGVIKNIYQTGRWDTNWAAADLPTFFKYDQYNFSSYIVASALLAKVVGPALPFLGLGGGLPVALRVCSAAFHVVAILLTYSVGSSLLGSRRVGVVAACLVALFPLLFQDSLYARPESFVAMLTLLAVLLAGRQCRVPRLREMSALGWVIGFLIAGKVSFLVLLVLPVLVGFSLRFRSQSIRMRWVGALSLSLVVGFAMGAPYALVNWSSFLRGVARLLEQYESVHLPHGLPDGDPTARIAHSWSYFSSIGAAPLILMALLGGVLIWKERRYVELFLAALFFLLLIYFSVKPVFFERNLSVCVPFLSLWAAFAAVGCVDRLPGSRTLRGAVLAGVVIGLVVPFSLVLWQWNTQVFSGAHDQRRQMLRAKLHQRYGVPVQTLGWVLSDDEYRKAADHLARGDRIYEFFGANDRYSRRYVDLAIDEFDLREIAELRSPLQAKGMPPSTMYTYHARQYFYLGSAHQSN